MVIKILIIEIIKLLIITVITAISIIINSNCKILWKWCKVGNGEMQYSVRKKKTKKQNKLKC